MRNLLYIGLLLASLATAAAPSLAQERVMTLDEMFNMAEESNLSLSSLRGARQEAGLGVASAKTGLMPDIDINVALSVIGNAWIADRDFSNGMNAETPHFGNTYSVAITQVLFAGGAIRNSISMASLRQDLASLSIDAARQSLRLVIAGYYLDLCKLRNQETILEKNIEQTRRLVDDIQANYAAGTALKSDITRYELQLQSLSLSLTRVRSAIDITSKQLSTALGSPDFQPVPDTTLALAPDGVAAEDEWQRLCRARPQARLAQKQVEIAQKSESLTRAGMRPTVALRVEDKLDGPITYEVPALDKNVNFWYAGVNISYNLGSVYKQRRKVNESRMASATAQTRLDDVLSQGDADIHAAYVKLLEARTERATREKSVQLAHENYDVIHYRYLNGMALITDMLDASNQQLDAELLLANSEFDTLYCLMILKATAGIL